MIEIKQPHILIYDDDKLEYFEGSYGYLNIENESIEYYCLDSPCEKRLLDGLHTTFQCDLKNIKQTETIKLDETLMKRIAKYNKDVEIQKLDKVIEEKQKKIEELDNILQDKDKRVDKIKEYIRQIYNIDVSDKYDEDWDD